MRGDHCSTESKSWLTVWFFNGGRKVREKQSTAFSQCGDEANLLTVTCGHLSELEELDLAKFEKNLVALDLAPSSERESCFSPRFWPILRLTGAAVESVTDFYALIFNRVYTDNGSSYHVQPCSYIGTHTYYYLHLPPSDGHVTATLSPLTSAKRKKLLVMRGYGPQWIKSKQNSC